MSLVFLYYGHHLMYCKSEAEMFNKVLQWGRFVNYLQMLQVWKIPVCIIKSLQWKRMFDWTEPQFFVTIMLSHF